MASLFSWSSQYKGEMYEERGKSTQFLNRPSEVLKEHLQNHHQLNEYGMEMHGPTFASEYSSRRNGTRPEQWKRILGEMENRFYGKAKGDILAVRLEELGGPKPPQTMKRRADTALNETPSKKVPTTAAGTAGIRSTFASRPPLPVAPRRSLAFGAGSRGPKTPETSDDEHEVAQKPKVAVEKTGREEKLDDREPTGPENEEEKLVEVIEKTMDVESELAIVDKDIATSLATLHTVLGNVLLTDDINRKRRLASALKQCANLLLTIFDEEPSEMTEAGGSDQV
ncbi:hypothetical protein BJ508DRAFT_308698 [Ascobolus immersus RN42]|uniref:Uncharacterized protein n=1 Tax=Ascobolus immersus RN42 TaxID=1160509 RepID=A0A3N4I370_ASCIM|nr:hypothetical protein BJ508DRAFT_308698 [Ascobolus immersus RN42]